MRKFVIFLIFFSCQARPESMKQKNEDFRDTSPLDMSEDNAVRSKPETLFDSILHKRDLSLEQIRFHSIVDTAYYTGPFADANFTSDTIFNIKSGVSVAVIEYNDQRNCFYRFLVTFSADGRKADHKVVSTDCDRDASSNYFIDSYKMLTDSFFVLTKAYIPPGDEDSVQSSEETMWKIDGLGRIVPYSL